MERNRKLLATIFVSKCSMQLSLTIVIASLFNFLLERTQS